MPDDFSPDGFYPDGFYPDGFRPVFGAEPPVPIPGLPVEIFGPQEGDILLFQTNDNGDINIENGLVQMTGRFDTAVYLSLFGGNEEDDGRSDNGNSWWGNIDETEPAHKYISITQNLIKSLPAISANLKRLEEAVLTDLQWFLDNKIASSVTAEVTIPELNQVQIDIEIIAFGAMSQFAFTENWKAAT